MRAATNEREIAEAQRKVLDALRALPQHRPARPLRVGIVGEYFTAADPASNLDLERKFLDMGVELHRALNMTNRNLRYNEKNLRAGISEYVQYDMGPTSSMTIAAARKYAQEGFDGIVHLKSSAARPRSTACPCCSASAATPACPCCTSATTRRPATPVWTRASKRSTT